MLLTEPPLNPRSNRDTAAQILFETFNVPALFTSIQAVLSLYASGRTTGIVLDSGDGVSHAVPVYEGFAMPSSIRRIDLAGRDVTEHMQTLLRKSGYVFHTSAEKEIVRHIKETTGYIALDPKKEEKDWLASRPGRSEGNALEYSLPDGSKIKVVHSFLTRPLLTLQVGSERFRAPEILFDPEIIGLEYPGIQQIIVDAIGRTDMDLRTNLYGNIVLSGGSTLTKGFGDRLLHEVRRLAVRDMRIKIFAPPERKYSTWIGGSILAGLSTFRKVSQMTEHGHGTDRARCGLVSTTGTRTPTSSIPSSPSQQWQSREKETRPSPRYQATLHLQFASEHSLTADAPAEVFSPSDLSLYDQSQSTFHPSDER